MALLATAHPLPTHKIKKIGYLVEAIASGTTGNGSNKSVGGLLQSPIEPFVPPLQNDPQTLEQSKDPTQEYFGHDFSASNSVTAVLNTSDNQKVIMYECSNSIRVIGDCSILLERKVPGSAEAVRFQIVIKESILTRSIEAEIAEFGGSMTSIHGSSQEAQNIGTDRVNKMIQEYGWKIVSIL